jgi:hypothetical protein
MIDAELSASISQRKIEQVLETGAEAVISACQQCVRTMATYCRRNKIKLKVMDITQLIHRALGRVSCCQGKTCAKWSVFSIKWKSSRQRRTPGESRPRLAAIPPGPCARLDENHHPKGAKASLWGGPFLSPAISTIWERMPCK